MMALATTSSKRTMRRSSRPSKWPNASPAICSSRMTLTAVGKAREKADPGGNSQHQKGPVFHFIREFSKGVAAKPLCLVRHGLGHAGGTFLDASHYTFEGLAYEFADLVRRTRRFFSGGARETPQSLFEVADQFLDCRHFFGSHGFRCTCSHFFHLNRLIFRFNLQRKRSSVENVPSGFCVRPYFLVMGRPCATGGVRSRLDSLRGLARLLLRAMTSFVDSRLDERIHRKIASIAMIPACRPHGSYLGR